MQFFLNEKEAEINYISSKLILNLFLKFSWGLSQ